MLIVAHNLTAMNTKRQFGINTKNKAKSTEKLSSGYRINRSADDAAGLSISEKMRRQIRGLTQGVQNTQEGVSLCQVADGALAEVNEMLHRITELSVKSANGTNTEEDREAIQKEINQILKEIERISDTTIFNEQKIFDGGEKNFIQLPSTIGKLDVTGTTIDTTAMTYNITANENGFSINSDNFSWKEFSDGVNTLADSPIKASIYSFDYHGFTLSLKIEDNTNIKDLIGRLNGASFSTKVSTVISNDKISATGFYGGVYQFSTPIPNNAEIKLHADDTGIWTTFDGNVYSSILNGETSYWHKQPYMYGDGTNLADTDSHLIYLSPGQTYGTGGNILGTDPLPLNVGISSKNGATKQDLINALNGATVHIELDTYYSDANNNKYWYKITGINLNATPTNMQPLPVIDKINQTNYEGVEIPPTQAETDTAPLNLWIQSGCESGDGMWLEIDKMNTSILGIKDIDVSTVSGANKALDVIGGALQKVSSNRAKIGAQQNRLEHTIANEENIIENTTAAESQIRDTDMAKEMVKLSNLNILEQVGHSLMAQANQSNQGVLSLLQ